MKSREKIYVTTKHTKATKVSDINTLEYLDFVLFATFVVSMMVDQRGGAVFS